MTDGREISEGEGRALGAAPAAQSALDPAQALAAALEWQLQAGVDETIGEAPVDRAAAQPQSFSPAVTAGDGGRAAKQPSSAAKGRAASAADAAETRDLEALQKDARRAAASARDLTALAKALEGFEGSSLKTGAMNCVFADGNPEAMVMAIGEGPGKDEDRLGKPFVGRSGQLLDRMFAAIGLDRAAKDPAASVYITNLVPWRPLGNRTPDDQEVAILTPFLERHIALAQPKLLICLGGAPAKHVMGAKAGVTRYRGTWIDYERDGLSIPCLATLHPAYLLRSPEMKRLAWRDLLALRARLDWLLEK